MIMTVLDHAHYPVFVCVVPDLNWQLQALFFALNVCMDMCAQGTCMHAGHALAKAVQISYTIVYTVKN